MSKKKDKAKRKSDAHKRAAAEKFVGADGATEGDKWEKLEESAPKKADKPKPKSVKVDADKPKKKKADKAGGAPAKPSIFARFAGYLKGVGIELKRVVWPSRQEVFNSTIIVLVTLVFFGIFAFIVDWLATGAMDIIIGIAAK